MSLLALMKETYPRTKQTRHSAFCERIPMAMFELVEDALRVEMRARGLRAMYRGPRVSNLTRTPTMTMRCDATHVLLYRK
jgi:hypothetical protein